MNKEIYGSPVLALFFDDPEGAFHIREIARQTKLHPNTVLRDATLLLKEGLVLKRVTRAVVEMRANRESPLFYALKRLANLRAIMLSGIIEELHKAYGAPEAIILFGSYSRGEDTKRSDIDIAVITRRQLKHDWSAYQTKLKRDVQIHEIDLRKPSKEFITNLANGIVLKGYLAL